MAQKWHLQDIKPAESKRTPPPVQNRKIGLDIAPRQPQPQPTFDDSDLSSIDIVDGKSNKRKKVIIVSIVAIGILAAGFGVNTLLGGADVRVFPKAEPLSVELEVTAYKKPLAGQLAYELMSRTAEGERQVTAKGKEQVSTKATGKIFIYNTKSTAPQKLVKNTRFETKDGLIFKINTGVEVPGAAKGSDGTMIPGKVAVDVTASSTGSSYNISPTKFSVPGLKGTDQFDHVYGESTASFTGGFEGEKYIIDEKELDTAKQALHMELREKLLKQLDAEKPAGFIVFKDAVALSFESLPATEYGESLATIKEKGTLNVPIFKADQFAGYLAEQTIPTYTGDPVRIKDPSAITFAYTDATTTVTDISLFESLTFNLKGKSTTIWEFDEKKLKSNLMGKNKNDAEKMFKSEPGIARAELILRPFWATKVPTNEADINIKTELVE